MDPTTPRESIMQFFKFDHLPPEKQEVSRVFADAAEKVHLLPRNPERTVALRKLLEAKDAAVRASFMVLAFLLCVVSFPALASATEAPAFVLGGTASEPSTPSFFAQFITPANIASVVVTLLGLIGGALGLSALRKRQIAIVTQHAFNAVEDFAATTETSVDDKIAAGLKVANEWMVAQGWRPLRTGELDVVRMGFTALNGATKVAEKVAANAQVAASKALDQVAGVATSINKSDFTHGGVVPPKP
jgi:hypothetical protein